MAHLWSVWKLQRWLSMSSVPTKQAPHTLASAPAVVGLAFSVALIGAFGALLMAIAHLGIDLPLLPTVGTGRAVPVAAAIFGLGVAGFLLVAFGLRRRHSWALPLGFVVGLLALSGAARPYRGVGSAVGIVLSVTLLITLLAPGTRHALRAP